MANLSASRGRQLNDRTYRLLARKPKNLGHTPHISRESSVIPKPLCASYVPPPGHSRLRLRVREWLHRWTDHVVWSPLAFRAYHTRMWNYQGYLKSTHWANTKAAFSKGKRKKCFICHTTKKRIDLHHRHYRTIGYERRKDLVFLCGDCHFKIHKYNLTSSLDYPRIKRTILKLFLKRLRL